MTTENDQAVNPMEGLTVIQATQAYINEARENARDRRRLDEQNRRAYDNEQDYSYKNEGQSTEFLPKTFETVEQFSAFLKKSLIQFGDWFSVEVPKNSPISAESMRKMMNCFLTSLPQAGSTTTFIERVTDGSKIALLESEMVFKVHGSKQSVQKMRLEKGELVPMEQNPWHLQIELVKNENYFKDPSGNGLFRIHRSERDLHEVQELAKKGIYDQAMVNRIVTDMTMPTEDQRDDDKEIDNKPSFRKKIVMDECWGTLLNPDGSVAKKNHFWTVANETYLIRKPQPFPFWHGEDPFVEIPLIRKPFSTCHKALYDAVVPLNNALNELFNLMLDGGIASVWGIKQLRPDYLEDPREVSDGIPQGKTLTLSEDAPDGAKVLEQVTEGQIPPEALSMFSIVDRETNSAALSNEIRQGILPSKAVKATEVMEASQNSAVLLDAISMDVEIGIRRVIKKGFLTVLQNADDLAADELAEHLTTRELFAFSRMSPQERFAMFSGCKFKVFGLSQTLTRGRDFQKIMAVIQAAQSSPILQAAMLRKVSPDKLWTRLMTLSNLNATDIERDEDDPTLEGDLGLAETMLGGQGGSPPSPTGEAGLQSDVNQLANPSGGL